jgi:N-acetylglucosamine-6-phosphate deacetylase
VSTIALRGARVLTVDGLREGLAVVIEAGRIAAVLPDSAAAGAAQALPPGSILAPGFIDVQVNGGGGVLFNDHPTAAAALAIAAAHRRFGTTSVLPTLITDRPAAMPAAFDAVRQAAVQPDGGVLGLHLEGPFISPHRPGVHARARIRRLEAGDIAWLAGLPAQLPGGRILLTLAPEETTDAALATLAGAGIILSAGHTAAPAARIAGALAAGLRGFTHLFNAMPPLAGRDPGPVGAALVDVASWCGIIADGVHVDPVALRLALRAKPRGRVFLVTDAMPPLGTPATTFQLYGETIARRDGRLLRADGTLAGADLDMAAAVRNCVALLGLEAEEALRMAACYPADLLGVTDRGRIAPGLRADLVLLSPALTVQRVWVGGVAQESEP